jgi:hypothetical protein
MWDLLGILKDYLDHSLRVQENSRTLIAQEYIPDGTDQIADTLLRFKLDISQNPLPANSRKLNNAMGLLITSSSKIHESLLQAKKRLNDTRVETSLYIGNMMAFFIRVVEIRSHIKATGAFIILLNSTLLELSKAEMSKQLKGKPFPDEFLALFKNFIEYDYFPTKEEKNYYAQKFNLTRIQIDNWLWNNRSRARKRKEVIPAPIKTLSGSMSETDSMDSMVSNDFSLISQYNMMIPDDLSPISLEGGIPNCELFNLKIDNSVLSIEPGIFGEGGDPAFLNF